jgi:hypothetical protein
MVLREHQSYAAEISSRPRVSSQIACFDSHSKAVQKGDNFKPIRLTCVAHVSDAGSKQVMHRLCNSTDVCNTCGSDEWGRSSVVNGSRDVTTTGSEADTTLHLNDFSASNLTYA